MSHRAGIMRTHHTDQFRIEITRQGWLVGCCSEKDLCSHGPIKLMICGALITDGSEAYGISESALALLRTLESDHSRTAPVAESMIFHGCGSMLMSGFGLGVDWSVTHKNKDVIIDDIRRYDGARGSMEQTFPNLKVKIPFNRYRKQIVGFARIARSLFEECIKRYDSEVQPGEYRDFWAEYDRLLTMYGPPLLPPLATEIDEYYRDKI